MEANLPVFPVSFPLINSLKELSSLPPLAENTRRKLPPHLRDEIANFPKNSVKWPTKDASLDAMLREIWGADEDEEKTQIWQDSSSCEYLEIYGSHTEQEISFGNSDIFYKEVDDVSWDIRLTNPKKVEISGFELNLKYGWYPLILKLHQLISYLFEDTFGNDQTNEWEVLSLWRGIYAEWGGSEQVNQEGKDKPPSDKEAAAAYPKIFICFNLGRWQKVDSNSSSALIPFIAHHMPTGALVLSIDANALSFCCDAHGRYDAYFLAILTTLFKPYFTHFKDDPYRLGIPWILLESWEMAQNRTQHALRVYRDSLLEWNLTEDRYQWYLTLLTSGSVQAVHDTVKDLEIDIWHSQFTEADDPSKKRLEKLLVALLGFSDRNIRDRSIVNLNCFYDEHDWQKEAAFVPLIRCIGNTFSVEMAFNDSPSNQALDFFLILRAPSFNFSVDYEVYSYHRFRWSHEVIEDDNSQDGTPKSQKYKLKASVVFGSFPRCGFYDWRIVKADRKLGSWLPLQGSFNVLRMNSKLTTSCPLITFGGKEYQRIKNYANLDAGTSSYVLQGRFIVQPRNIRNEQLHEIFVDQHDARWNEASGELAQRGSFSSVASSIQQFRKHGISTLYLMGSLCRDNGDKLYNNHGYLTYERPDASPFAVTCRATPNEMLGDSSGFYELMKEAKRFGVFVVVDSLARVSSSRHHRKYWPLVLHTLDEHGKKIMLYGSDGRAIAYEDSAMLNYRHVSAWDLLVSDLKVWATQFKVNGVRLDNAQAWPLILKVDERELNRLDTDGQCHYTPEDKLFGVVVVPLTGNVCGFWDCPSSKTYPNPIFVKICKELWRVCREFAIYAECWESSGLEGRPAVLAKSGVIPQLQQLPNVLCKVFGREINSEGHVVTLEEPESIHVLIDWFERCHESLPDGACVVQSSCSHFSPLPGLLYGRGAWPAVDLLFFLPDMPSTFMGEMEGMSFRFDVANVYQTHEIARYVKDDRGSFDSKAMKKHSAFCAATSTRSLVNLPEIMVESERSTLDSTKGASTVARSSLLSRVRSLNTFEHVKNLSSLEKNHLKQLGPESGFDLKKIRGHYDHRRLIRSKYRIFQEGAYYPLRATDLHGSFFGSVLPFARYFPGMDEFCIVVINFGAYPQNSVCISLSALEVFVTNTNQSDAEAVYVSKDILLTTMDGNEDNNPTYHVKQELFAEYLTLDLPAYGSVCRSFMSYARYKRIKSAVNLKLEDLYLSAKSLDNNEEFYAVSKAIFRSSLERLRLLLRQSNAQSLVARKQDSRFEYLLRRNVVLSNLVRNLPLEVPIQNLMGYLMFLQEVFHDRTLNKKSLELSVFHEIIVDCGIFSEDEDLSLLLAAKLKYLASLHVKTFQAQEIATQFLTQNALGPIVFVTPELGKWSTVGGLGVMVDELSTTLAQDFGQEVWVISPYYNRDRKGATGYLEKDDIHHTQNIEVKIANSVYSFGVHVGKIKGVQLFFLHNSQLFPHPYPQVHGADAIKMLVGFAKSTLETLCQYRTIPQLIVSNDWMTSLIPAYAKQGHFGKVFDGSTFFHIIHNLDPTYEGRIYPDKKEDFQWIHGLPTDLLVDPFWHQYVINPSRCVLLQCDAWGTVSPSYCSDLRGLTGNNHSPLAALLNRYKSPFAHPNGIPIESRKARIRALGVSGHVDAKGRLQKLYFGFNEPDNSIPLFAFIGRITSQKGVHLLLETAENLFRRYEGRIQILIGGMAEKVDPYSQRCAHRMIELKKRYPWSFWADPNDFFSNGPLVNCGADFALMPSAFEPGGIVQHEFFVAGTPVIAFYTGGLKDTVFEYNLETHEGNGFIFESYTPGDLLFAMERAIRVFRDEKKYGILRENASRSVVSCEQVAKEWLKEFYRLRRKIYINPHKVDIIFDRLKSIKYSDNIESPDSTTTFPSNGSGFTALSVSSMTPDTGEHGTVIATERGPIRTAPPPSILEEFEDSSTFPSWCSRISSFSASEQPLIAQTQPSESTLETKAMELIRRVPFRINYPAPSGSPRPRSVAVTGSFDDWAVRRPLQWDNALQAYTVAVTAKPGKYLYKLIVDGDWVCNQCEKTEEDKLGNINNVIDVSD